MKWTQITVDTTCEAVDLISAFLTEEGVLGVQVDDNTALTEEEMAEIYADLPPDDIKEDDGTARVSFFLDDGQNEEEIVAAVKGELKRLSEFVDVGTGEIQVSTTCDEDWINNWKAYFKPFRIYDNIVIKPTWEENPPDIKDDDIVIEIDPGTAFGTGSHETTKLCIGQLKKHMKKGAAVLDAGSGSGILSFICNKLGASHVYGVDIDPVAVEVAGENRDTNNISADQVEFACGNILTDDEFVKNLRGRFDVVVANILADVIIPLSGKVSELMKDDGIFISSGIIDMKEDEVRKAILDNGLKIVDTVHMKEWVSFVAVKGRK